MSFKFSLLLLVFSVFVVLTLPHCFSGYSDFNDDKELAFKECLEEVSNNCKSTIEYAVLLEKENARLNRLIKMEREKCTQK